MTPVAYLRSLTPLEYVTFLGVTALLCCSLGFAGAVLLIVYGPQQGTGTAGAVTDGARGDP